MIKIAIIIILILLLVITLYSYYCLSSQMINFEKSRLEHILKKEVEVSEKEKKIKTVTDCSNKNDSYQEAIKNINSIISSLNLPPGSVCQNYVGDEYKQTINNIKSIILQEKSHDQSVPTNSNNNINLDCKTNSENQLNIYHEVPQSFIESTGIEQKSESEYVYM